MPELPEVETVRRGLAPVMENHEILNVTLGRPDLRFAFPPDFGERLTGQTVTRLDRKAKFLCGELTSGETLIMHLGMSGRFTISGALPGKFHHGAGTLAVHDHVRFAISGGVEIVYNDPRRFGFMELWPTARLQDYPRLRAIGPEPLSNHFHAPYLTKALAGRKISIKAALLDQKVIAGLGNIYVCEALFRAGLSPRRKADSVTGVRAERLAGAIKAVISEAIEAGGSSLKDFAATDGALGYFQHGFRVYDREGTPCPVCASPVRRIVQSGRSSFYCGQCQR